MKMSEGRLQKKVRFVQYLSKLSKIGPGPEASDAALRAAARVKATPTSAGSTTLGSWQKAAVAKAQSDLGFLQTGWNALRGLASGAVTLTAKDVGQKAALTTVTTGVGFGVNKVLNRASARFETGGTVKAATVQSIAQPTVSSIVSSSGGGGGYGGGYLQPAQEEENSLAWLALLGVLARAFFF